MLNPRELKIAALCIVGTVAVSAATTSVAASFVISRGTQVKPGVLQVRHLSANAQAALKGRTGATGATGAAGATGGTGATGARGPSDAYSTSFTASEPANPAITLTTTYALVAELTPPAGAYAVVANATLDQDGVGTGSGRCRVIVAGAGTVAGTERSVGLDTNADFDDIHGYSSAGVLAPTNPPVIQLQCKSEVGTAVKVSASSLLAIQTGAIHQS